MDIISLLLILNIFMSSTNVKQNNLSCKHEPYVCHITHFFLHQYSLLSKEISYVVF